MHDFHTKVTELTVLGNESDMHLHERANEDMKGSNYLATWLANCPMAFGRLTPNFEKN